jgi:hypothetical protein
MSCWHPYSAVGFSLELLLASLLLLTFLLSDSGGPAAVDTHDVPFVPAAAVISDVTVSLL